MTIQKYRIRKGESFTTVSTNVVQNLKDYAALGLYVYLLSLPEGWIFYKKQLSEHTKIGRDKINKLLKILSNHNLIEYVQNRDNKGMFTCLDLYVKDGRDFKINNLEKLSTPLTENPLTDNQLLDNSTYKRNNTKETKNKKREREATLSTGSISEPVDNKKRARKKRVPLSDYKPDEKMNNAIAEVEMRTGNRDLFTKFQAVMRRSGKLLSLDWDTELVLFLNRERPNGTNIVKNISYNNNEVRSTVPWFSANH